MRGDRSRCAERSLARDLLTRCFELASGGRLIELADRERCHLQRSGATRPSEGGFNSRRLPLCMCRVRELPELSALLQRPNAMPTVASRGKLAAPRSRAYRGGARYDDGSLVGEGECHCPKRRRWRR